MSISTVGERAVAMPSLTLTLLTWQPAPIQSFSASALVARYVPNIFTNETSLAIRASSFLASCSFHASHSASSTLTRASVLASGVALAGAAVLAEVFELAAVLTSFFGSSFLAAGAGGGVGAFGSTIRFSPWKTACHLSPLRTQMLAERIGLGTFARLPSGPLHVPSQVAL